MKRYIPAMAALAATALALSCSAPTNSAYEATTTKSGLTTYSAITVNPIAGLSSTFIKGVDASMVRQIELCEGSFYDEDNTEKDALTIFREHGVNWVRLRIWNNHVDSDGNWLGGGNNDLAKTLNIAVRAKALGMKVLLDFHYSDTWADPTHQKVPAAWAALVSTDTAGDALETALYNYTYNVVDKLAKAGAAPDMVQIGNEIQNGLMTAKVTTDIARGQILSQGSAAVRAAIVANGGAATDVKIMLHMANINTTTYTTFLSKFTTGGTTTASVAAVDYDVIGLSWYPYYTSHGTWTTLKNAVANLKTTYGKDVLVAETSYGFSSSAYGDSTSNTFWTTQETTTATAFAGYDENSDGTDDFASATATPQMQANVVRAIMKIVSDNGGLGVFYWGGDWICVDGAGLGYDPSGTYYEGTSWENQALFDIDGKALPSLNVFNVSAN